MCCFMLNKLLTSLFICLVGLCIAMCSTPSGVPERDNALPRWEKIGPGGGGSTFMPVFSYNSPGDFVVRCDMTGTYFTKDGGVSYQQINLPNGSSAYAYDPSDENTLYVGASVLKRSIDGGREWSQIFPDPQDVTDTIYHGDHAGFSFETSDSLFSKTEGRINSIRVDPDDGETIYFSRNRYFFFTTDAGENWNMKDIGLPVSYIYAGSNSDDVLIFTASNVLVFDQRSEDVSQMALSPEMSPAFSFTGGKMAGSDSLIFYALHNNPETERGEFGETTVWRSKDKAKTWERFENPTVLNSSSGITPSYSTIACAENDASHAYLVSNRYEEKKSSGESVHWYGALKTADGGETWTWVWKGGGGSGQYGVKDGVGVTNLEDAWVEAAFGGEYIRLLDAGVYPQDGNVAVVTDWYRVMKTTDGGKTWREVYSVRQPDGAFVSRGMDVTTVYGVHFDPFDEDHLAISYTDIGYHHSYDGGKSWHRSVEGVPSEWVNTCYWMVFDPDVKDKIWSVWSSLHDFPRGKMTRNPNWKTYGKGGVCVSVDGGKTWMPSNDGMGFDSPATSIVLDANSKPGERILYASVYSKGVFKSTDDGRTWALKNAGIDENTAAFELTLQDNGTLFLTVSPTPVHKNGKTGTAFYSGAVYRSVDGAETWTKLNITDGLLFPSGIEFDPANPDRIYLACWADITLSDLVGGSVVREHGEENRTLEMPGGIFLSEDGGESWKSVFDQDQYVYDVTADASHPGRLYCNTFNQSAWKSDDYGHTWKQIEDYDFHWGHRVIVDKHDTEKVYLTTYGSSVWYGKP
jgi:photosystem II stability/assembly factor-like uncharacterized protein